MSYADEKKRRCVHCAAGSIAGPGLSAPANERVHWFGYKTLLCTAPLAEEYIAELEAELTEARKETVRLDWLLADIRLSDHHDKFAANRADIDAALEGK